MLGGVSIAKVLHQNREALWSVQRSCSGEESCALDLGLEGLWLAWSCCRVADWGALAWLSAARFALDTSAAFPVPD
jgi:hypothetical protein